MRFYSLSLYEIPWFQKFEGHKSRGSETVNIKACRGLKIGTRLVDRAGAFHRVFSERIQQSPDWKEGSYYIPIIAQKKYN